MNGAAVLSQALNGLSSAASLFLVAAGLTLIFGVSRVVNFAHGSFYMIGLYVAISVAQSLRDVLGDGMGFWLALPAAALAVALLGAVVERLLLRRIERAPELMQLLATFALVLLIKDAALALWGPVDQLGPRAPGMLGGALDLFGERVPAWDLVLVAVGVGVLIGLQWLVGRTRWGTLVRAATQDREMVRALGVDARRLSTQVFALGAGLAGLGGALQMPREPASLALDLAVIGDAFVVVVVGGMGSVPGAWLAALLIGAVKAVCVAIGTVHLGGLAINLSKLTLVAEFLVMAAVLAWRPWGLLGRPEVAVRAIAEVEPPLKVAGRGMTLALAALFAAMLAWPWLLDSRSYALVLGIDILSAVLFAASLQFVMGPGGMHSFGHAAYFGLGAYAAALAERAGWGMAASLAVAPLAAAAGAALVAAVGARLSGVYLAMLTLAFAQIVWAVVFQWDELTGGSNGLTGVWPPPLLGEPRSYFIFALLLCGLGAWLLRRLALSPFGLALRAARDAPRRAEASGLPVAWLRALAFVIGGSAAGLAGAVYAFSKGSISPDVSSVARSVDALVMVMLGGLQSLAGPWLGAAVFTWLQDTVARQTEYWRALLGGVILLLVLVLPRGLAGLAHDACRAFGRRRKPTAAPLEGAAR